MLQKFKLLSLVSVLLLALSPALSMAQVSVSVTVAPPELPVYDQPPIPGDGYIWTPGYWAWGDDIQDYYWVPGTWVEAPQPQYLWTPGYWGAEGAAFLWHAGYWGPQVGFYGGVNYGYGYGGRGYEGGYWQDGHLFYNRAVVNVGSAHITNVYNKTVINNVSVTRVSYNGGNGGVRAQPTATETAAGRERHIEATAAQRQHVQTARTNPELRASSNHGHPSIAATPRAGSFANAVPARNAAAVGTEHANPQPRLSTPRPTEAAPKTPAPATREAAASSKNGGAPAHEVRPVTPTGAPPQEHPQQHAQPQPQEHAAPAKPVEPRREPEHTAAVKPAPNPQAHPAPRPEEHPAPHSAEHPDEHEHH